MLFFWRKVKTYWKGESVMKKLDTKKLGMDILIDIIGGILIAIGTYNFAAMAKFPMVGFNGIALIFYHLFGLPIGTVAMLLNIPVAIVCFRILGKDFFIRSIRTIIITSVIMTWWRRCFQSTLATGCWQRSVRGFFPGLAMR